MSGYSIYSYKKILRVNDWLNDETRTKGCTAEQVQYLRDLKELRDEYSRMGVVMYFMLTRLNMPVVRQMMISAKKVKSLIEVLINDLKTYRVDKKYEKAFNRDIDAMRNRCDHVYKIVNDDLRLTEHYPFFEKVGFKRLLDFDLKECAKTEGNEVVLDKKIIPEMEAWETEHRDEINAHMASIKAELSIYNAHLAKIKAMKEKEKEEARARKKAEKEEIKEIETNRKADKKRRDKLDRELESTVKRVWGGWNNV